MLVPTILIINIFIDLIDLSESVTDKPSKDDQEKSKDKDWKQLFEEHNIVPDVLSEMPSHLLSARTFDGEKIIAGHVYNVSQLIKSPQIKFHFDQSKNYTIFILNPDIPSRTNAYEAEWQHAAIFNVPGGRVPGGE